MRYCSAFTSIGLGDCAVCLKIASHMSIEVQQEIAGAASQNSWTTDLMVALECRLDAKLRCAPPPAGIRGLGARAALLQMQHDPMRTGQRTTKEAAAAPGAKSRHQVGNTLMQGAGRAHAASTPVGVKLLGVANASRRCGLGSQPSSASSDEEDWIAMPRDGMAGNAFRRVESQHVSFQHKG